MSSVQSVLYNWHSFYSNPRTIACHQGIVCSIGSTGWGIGSILGRFRGFTHFRQLAVVNAQGIHPDYNHRTIKKQTAKLKPSKAPAYFLPNCWSVSGPILRLQST